MKKQHYEKYSHEYQGMQYLSSKKQRSKADWARTQSCDAFKHNLDFYICRAARRLYYQQVKAGQIAAAKVAGDRNLAPKTKPKISLCYTGKLLPFSVQASIGLSTYFEFTSRIEDQLLLTHLSDYIENSPFADRNGLPAEVFGELVKLVIPVIQNRLILHELAKLPSLRSVETYRLFACASDSLRLTSLKELLDMAVLYSDLLPVDILATQGIHPITKDLLEHMCHISLPFQSELQNCKSADLVPLGIEWTKSLTRFLGQHIRIGALQRGQSGYSSAPDGEADQPFTLASKILPLNSPRSPILDPLSSEDNSLRNWIIEDEVLGTLSGVSSNLGDQFKQFSEAVREAASSTAAWHDMRSDQIEQAITGGFKEGPFEGTLSEGHSIEVDLDGEQAGGEIHEKTLDPSDDYAATTALIEKAQPVTDALRRNIYPDVQEIVSTRKFLTSGLIDSSRLPLAGVSDAVFKRNLVQYSPDRRGRPCLLIAADASGSLNSSQMLMLKILTTGWLNAIKRTGIRLLAALYHSGQIRDGLSGPLVQWIVHPKSLSRNTDEAVAALANLPASGTGCQSDALSWAFLIPEAERISRGSSIYAVILSDCSYNRSFSTSKSGQEEVQSVLANAYADLGKRLHVTLVALGVSNQTGLEGIIDNVIPVSDSELSNVQAVAEKIGVYVANCIRLRRMVGATH